MAASAHVSCGMTARAGPFETIPTPDVGIAALIPGVAQWKWRQRDRGLVFLGTFLASMSMGLFGWGSILGWAFLGCAFLTHLAASVDVIRQLAFPVFHPVVAFAASGFSLAFGLYLPLATSLFLFAFPVRSTDLGAGYLVNCLAYNTVSPARGQWVWFRLEPRQAERAGQILATEGQEVEWTGRRWRVDGRNLLDTHPGTLPHYPESWRFSVPKGHVLVGPERTQAEPGDGSSLMIVGHDQIIGRAWGRCYPFWERSLL